ncbi:MAG: HupE/UreJ family protein, partial [Pseudomonadota bacterium]|nr:HupE/UreJ family protein [Pseudomonadota bacterium]
LVSLGFVTNPEALIEWLIAVSIWVLALELSRPEKKSRLWDKPWYLAGGFGLLHGMGFAGALAETGLPQMHLPTALLFFNVGIELGQLAFIALLTLAGAMISKISRAPWLQIAPVYLLGAVSTFWVLDRTGSLFG